jgi:hypothetical protein
MTNDNSININKANAAQLNLTGKDKSIEKTRENLQIELAKVNPHQIEEGEIRFNSEESFGRFISQNKQDAHPPGLFSGPAALLAGNVVYDQIEYDENDNPISATSSKCPECSVTYNDDGTQTRRQEFDAVYDHEGNLKYGDVTEITYDINGKAVFQRNESVG